MPELRPFVDPDTVPLFAPLRSGLVTLLRDIMPADWDRPTVAGAWRVRDVVAHLLDGELRTLAAHRDGHSLASGNAVQSYADVVALIQRLNAEGVAAGRHLSPRILTDLLAITGPWMAEFVATLDPDAPALFAVAWAGEAASTNRFDTAREYTERWHHEMQIRLAVGERGRPHVLLERRYVVPLLETAVRVLPHVYRVVEAPPETMVAFAARVPKSEGTARGEGDASAFEGLEWTLRREGSGWRLYRDAPPSPTARVTASADAWWRLFFNAMPVSEAPRLFAAEGSVALVEPLWQARSVMV
jgi:hypothetical protein